MSTTIFKTHPANIPQIKEVIRQKGFCWFHGDGNMYAAPVTEGPITGDHSLNAVKYTNPLRGNANNSGPGAFRVRFDNVNQVPDTVEEINAMLIEAKGKEMQLQGAEKSYFGANVMQMPSGNEKHVYAQAKADEVAKLQSEKDALQAAHDAEIEEVNKAADGYIKNISADRDKIAKEAQAAKDETAKLRAELEALKAAKVPAPAEQTGKAETKTDEKAAAKEKKATE